MNAIDPQRLIIGGSGTVYESLNQGTTITPISSGIGVNATFNGEPIAYGGRRLGVNNPNVLYVGYGNQIYLRTTAAGPADGDQPASGRRGHDP